jgi:hypothetical protein
MTTTTSGWNKDTAWTYRGMDLDQMPHMAYADRRTARTEPLIKVGAHVLTDDGFGTVTHKRFAAAEHGTVYSVRLDDSHHVATYYRDQIATES